MRWDGDLRHIARPSSYSELLKADTAAATASLTLLYMAVRLDLAEISYPHTRGDFPLKYQTGDFKRPLFHRKALSRRKPPPAHQNWFFRLAS